MPLLQLNAAWKSWWTLVHPNWIATGEDDAPLAPKEDCQILHERLRRFHPERQNTADELDVVLQALSKGKCLLEAAVGWEEPAIGPSRNGCHTGTCYTRGEQWRLVMAYAALETVFHALLPPFERCKGLTERIDRFIELCGLIRPERLDPPNRDRKTLERWLQLEDRAGKHPMLHFLGMDNGDASILRLWLIENQPLTAGPH